LLGNPIAQLIHRFGHKVPQLVPVRLLGVSLVLLSFPSHAVAKSSRLGPHLRVVQQLLDVAHSVRPLTEALAPHRSARTPRPAAPALASPLWLPRPVFTLLSLVSLARIAATKSALP